jgi:hypothetical protein
MVTISGELRIERSAIEAWVDKLLSLDVPDALSVLSKTNRFIPRTADAKTRAERLRQQFPLQHLMPRKTLNERGQIVASSASQEEQEALSEMDAYLQELMLRDLELGPAFDRLEVEKGLDPAALMAFLRGGRLFTAETLDTVAVGVERFFGKDYVSAMHVLVPQLEDTLRDMLEQLGSSRTSMQPSGQREKPIDVVLADGSLRQVLGEDLADYLEVLLTEQRGPNLRHRTAHGLMKVRNCTREAVQRVLHGYLQLAARHASASKSVDSGDVASARANGPEAQQAER